MLEVLGVAASFSRPRVSNDNPFSEALFRTAKYRPQYPRRPFKSLDEAHSWAADFVHWYNTEHRHSAIRFVTPDERHSGRDVELLAQRAALYATSRERRPERWTGSTRNWAPVREVALNPASNTPAEAAA
jgi:hypothetical protein